MNVIRPADGNETRSLGSSIRIEDAPTSLVLTRQNLTTMDLPKETVEEGVRKGAYVVFESDKEPEFLLLATGSEVNLALEAAKDLEAQGKCTCCFYAKLECVRSTNC